MTRQRNGSNGGDWIWGSWRGDTIYGHGGNDYIFGLRGNDRIWGGSGDDRIWGGSGHDELYGGSGNDLLVGGSGGDILDGGSGRDWLYGQSGRDSLIFNAAENSSSLNDYYDGGRGVDKLIIELTGAEYNESVRADLLAFIDWIDARTFRGTVNYGTYNFDTLNLSVARIEQLVLRVDGELVDPNTPINANVKAENDAFVIAEDSSIFDTVISNDSPSTGGTVRLISGVSRGMLTLSGDGNFSFDASDFDSLAEGETTTESFTYELEANGSADTATVTLTITGTNDVATVTIDADADLAVVEDQDGVASGSLTVIDPDTNEARIDLASVSDALYGTFSIDQSGAWSYALDQANTVVQALAEGETLQENVTAFSADGTASATLNITITGTNDIATVTIAAGGDLRVTEDEDDMASGNLMVVDPDNGETQIDVSSVSAAAYGIFSIDENGAWTYALDQTNSIVQALAEGENVQDSVTVFSADGTASATLDITITGTNDGATAEFAPGADFDVQEDQDLVAGGRIIVTDPDTGEAGVDPLSASTALYGDFTVDAFGNWSYNLDNSLAAVQALGAGAVLTDTITVDSIDGTATSTILIMIAGSNDAPQLITALGPQQAKAGELFSLAASETNFTDIDTDDVLTLSAALDGGGALPSWLNFDPATGLFSGTPDVADAGTFTVALTATDAGGDSAADFLSFGVSPGDPPAVATLSLSSVDGDGAGNTTAASVSLVGVADAGDRVNLFDGEGTTLLGTTITNNEGQFRFTGIVLELGDNAFEVETVDAETGLSSRSDDQVFVRLDDAGEPINAALFWTHVALDAIAASGASPNYASRAMAMQSQAVFNTIAAVEGSQGYEFNIDAPDGASVDAAIAQAAYAVLAQLFPSQRDALGAALDARLANVTDGLAEGLGLGVTVAQRVLEIRADDGWNVVVTDTGRDEDGVWRPTGPGFRPGADPQWGDVDPFVVNDVENFRPDAPPSILTDTITDDEYASDYERTLALGRADSTDRTADQSEIARFWQDGAGTETPAGHWTSIAAQVAEAEGLSLSETANLMLQLNLAMADAGIAAFDTKYAYDVWRPLTVTQDGGDVDGTQIDPTLGWVPFVSTPNHPEYVSGHSSYSAAGAAVLTHFFGENYAFTTTSESIATPTFRSFDSFWAAAEEAGASRIYGGIHWEFSNAAGKDLGAAIANAVIDAFDTTEDTIAPRVFIDQDGGNAIQAATFSGFVIDNLTGVDSFRVSIDGGDYLTVDLDSNGNFSVDSGLATDGSADGTHELQFIALDLAGNIALDTIEFVVASGAPDIALSGDIVTGLVDAYTRLSGEVDFADGNQLVSLRYAINGGESLTISFDPSVGKANFDQAFDIGDLGAGDHNLEITAVDRFGNSTTENFAFTLDADPLLTITNVTPGAGEASVALTFRPLIEFSTAVDITTLNPANIFALDSAGEALAVTIRPLDDGTGAWVFFDEPLPGSSVVQLVVDGDAITTSDGRALDGDGDGVAGGDLVQAFTTLSNTSVEGTTIVGRILDPGADYQPMTPDDYIAGPQGATDWDGHEYLNPLANVKVFILGREDEAVFTDENGYFELTNVPGGSVKVAVDGRTATNAAEGFFFPEMVMNVDVAPGVENTIMAGMGSREAKLANIGNEAVYLPRVDENILVDIDDAGVTTVTAMSENGSVLTAEQLDLISIDVTGGSLLDENGDVIQGAQVGISTVPPDIVRDMLPDGILQHTFDITIQAPAGAVFTEEAQITFPNVFNMAPGEQTFILSFDHTTGELVIDGTATVSEDGLTLVSDPGSGIDQPGWHGFTPPGFRVGGYGPGVICPPAGSPGHPDGIDFIEVNNDLSTILGIGVFGTKVLESSGQIKGFSDSVGGKSLGVANAASRAIKSGNEFGNVIAEIEFARSTGQTVEGVGPPDALYYGAKTIEAGGQIARTFLNIAGGMFKAVPGFKEAGKITDVANTTLLAIDTGQTIANRASGFTPKSIDDVDQMLDNPPPPKPVGTPGIVPGPTDYQPLREANDMLKEKVLVLKDIAERQMAPLENMKDAIQRIKDGLPPEDGPGNGNPDLPPSLEELEDILDIDIEAGDFDSEFIDAYEDLLAAFEEFAQIPSIYDAIDEVVYWYQVVIYEYGEVFGDDPLRLGDDAVGPDDSVVEHYEYHHTLYGAAVDIETGEIIRFSFASGEQWDIILQPETTYQMYFMDPASGFVSTNLLDTGLAGQSLIPDGNGENGWTAPILLPDNSEIQVNGLTEIQSLIVGANPNIVDSLLPGTGINDLQALLSGTAETPLILNQSGPIASVDLLGEANAVALSGGGNNGAGLTAFVATGDYGFAIVDVSNPQAPVILNQIELVGTATSIVASDDGRTVAIGLGDGGVVVYDTSNPLAVEMSYSLDTANALVELVGETLVVADGSSLSFYDFGSGAVSVAPFDIDPAAAIEALHWDGDRLIVFTDNNRVHLLSEDEGVFTVRSNIFASGLGSQEQAIAVDGDILLIGGFSGYSSIDISNIDAPVEIDTPTVTSAIGTAALAVNGSGRGVTAGDLIGAPNSATVVDTRTGGDEDAFITSFGLNGTPTDVEIAGRMAFITTGIGGLQVVAYGAVDTQGVAPTIVIDSQPEDIDGATPGIQLLEGSLADFRVSVADDVLVQSVQLLINGAVVDSDITYDWSLASFLPTIAGNGDDTNITIELRAIDTGGNIGSTGVIDVEIVSDTNPFEVVAVRPADGAALAEGRNYVSIEFSKALDPIYSAFDRFTLTGPDGTVSTPVALQLFDNDTQIRLAFDLASVEAGNYAFAIDADSLFDRFGNALGDTPIVVNYGASDATATWISPITGDWENAANWADGTLPDADDTVLVAPVDGTTSRVTTNYGDIQSLTVNGSGIFSVAPTTGTFAILDTDSFFNNGNTLLAGNGSLFNSTGQLRVAGQFSNNGTITLTDSSRLEIGGEFSNSGSIVVNTGGLAQSGGGGVKLTATDSTLSGGGSITLVDGGQFIGAQPTILDGTPFTHFLTNVDHTVSGTGEFGGGFAYVHTAGGSLFAADGDVLRLAAGSVDNNGLIEARVGGVLEIDSIQSFGSVGGIFARRGPTRLDNVDGRIEANGGVVKLTDSIVNGGYFGSSEVDGTVGYIDLDSVRLNGIVNTIIFDGLVKGDGYAQVEGNIENRGVLELDPATEEQFSGDPLVFDSQFTLFSNTTLTGGGIVRLNSAVGTDFQSGEEKTYYGRIDSDMAFQQVEEIIDPETGEVIFEEVVSTGGYTLTNVDNIITGSGWIGANPDPEEFGGFIDYREVADIAINNEVGGSIVAENGDTLTINHAFVDNDGLIEARSGGTLVGTQETFVFNNGVINAIGGTIEFGSYTRNNGAILIDGGTINFGSTFDNGGTVTITNGGSADMRGLVRNGGNIIIDDGSLNLFHTTTQEIDVGGGAADILFGIREFSATFSTTGSLDGTLSEFGSDDSVTFDVLDFADGVTLNFVGDETGGILTLTDGTDTVELDLGYVNATGLGDANPEAHFFLTESAGGGTILTTDLLAGQSASVQFNPVGMSSFFERAVPFMDLALPVDNSIGANQIVLGKFDDAADYETSSENNVSGAPISQFDMGIFFDQHIARINLDENGNVQIDVEEHEFLSLTAETEEALGFFAAPAVAFEADNPASALYPEDMVLFPTPAELILPVEPIF